MAPAQAFLCRYLWYFSLEIPPSYLKASLCIVNDLSLVEVPSPWLFLNQDRNVTMGLAAESSWGEPVFSNKRWLGLKVIQASLWSTVTTEQKKKKKGQNPLGFSPLKPLLRINCEWLLLCHRSLKLSMKVLWWLWGSEGSTYPQPCSIPASGSGKSDKLNSKKQHTLWASLPPGPWELISQDHWWAPRTASPMQEALPTARHHKNPDWELGPDLCATYPVHIKFLQKKEVDWALN